MLTFKEYLKEFATVDTDNCVLLEKAIQFGGQSDSRFGNIVILAGGAGCFASGTLVKTTSGDKPIEQIIPGDTVYTVNEATGTTEEKKVLEMIEHDNTKSCVRVTLENGDSFVCTEDHEFYVDGKWVKAIDLM